MGRVKDWLDSPSVPKVRTNRDVIITKFLIGVMNGIENGIKAYRLQRRFEDLEERLEKLEKRQPYRRT